MMGNGAARIMLNNVVNGNHAQPMNNGFQKDEWRTHVMTGYILRH